MAELKERICEACRVDAPKLSDEELKELMPQIPLWQLVEVDGIKRLEASFEFGNFQQALAFTMSIGNLAEEHQHHPQIILEWGKVRVSWWTHKINGLHLNDVIMSAKTDECFASEHSG